MGFALKKGKMITKSKVSVTLDSKLFKSFSDRCRERAFNRSSLIERLVREWMFKG